MDSEQFFVTEQSAERVNSAKRDGRKVVAIGTTVMRTMETAVSTGGMIKPMEGWTNKFIFHPYDFTVADAMVSNFHLPYSTQLMMVAAFGGYECVMNAYRIAKEEGVPIRHLRRRDADSLENYSYICRDTNRTAERKRMTPRGAPLRTADTASSETAQNPQKLWLHAKILYVCQEIYALLPESELSGLSRRLAQAMQERGNEIRTFMPRYGCINERRNQLHEVIRLSA